MFGERDRITTPNPDRRKLTFSDIEEEAVREGEERPSRELRDHPALCAG